MLNEKGKKKASRGRNASKQAGPFTCHPLPCHIIIINTIETCDFFVYSSEIVVLLLN